MLAVVPGPLHRDTLTHLVVLVVEDDLDSRELLGEYLGFRGAAVTSAPSVAAALAVLDSVDADVIISDVALPDEDGYALLGHVRATPKTAQIPAIALSGHRADDAERARAGRAGFNAYMEKPVDLEKLVALIRELVPGARRWR